MKLASFDGGFERIERDAIRCLVNGEIVQDPSTEQTVEIERIRALMNTVRVVAPRGGSR